MFDACVQRVGDVEEIIQGRIILDGLTYIKGSRVFLSFYYYHGIIPVNMFRKDDVNGV